MSNNTLFSNENEKMKNFRFRMMSFAYKIRDLFKPVTPTSLNKYSINSGDVIIDYGCGPGSYTKTLSHLVGKKGTIYAVDIHPLAIKAVKAKIDKNDLHNVIPVLVNGYSTGIEDQTADKIIAFDMFHMIENPTLFLDELRRLLKRDGKLFIENGHQSRDQAKAKIQSSNIWRIELETDKFMQCTPIF